MVRRIRTVLILIATVAMFGGREAAAQTPLPRIEVGVLFSHVRFAAIDPLSEYHRQHLHQSVEVTYDQERGLGGRIAIPVRRWFALETDLSVFLRGFSITPEAVFEANARTSEKTFLFAGPRFSWRVKHADLVARVMPGLVQVGLIRTIERVEHLTIRGRTFESVGYGEVRATVARSLKIGAGVSWPISGRLRGRADVNDVLVSYDLQSEAFRLAFRRHNLAVEGGITMLMGRRSPPGAAASGSWAAAFNDWEFGAYFGTARNSPVGTHLGATPNRDHLFVALQARKTMVRRGRWSGSYAPEVVPLLLLSNNPRNGSEVHDWLKYAAGPYATPVLELADEGPSRIAGFAITPLSLETDYRWTSRWRTFAHGGLGGVWFTRGAPIREARSFNYTFEFGGGVIRDVGRGRSVRVGYKFHHFSNDFTSFVNPGVDGHVFLFGYGWSGTH